MSVHLDIVPGFDHRATLVTADQLKSDLARTGDDSGRAWGQGFTKGADGRLRDERGRFVKAGQDMGADLGKGMSDGFNRELPRFKAGLVDAANATRAFREEQQKLQNLMSSGAGWDVIERQSRRTADAHNFARDSAQMAGAAFGELEAAQRALASSAGQATGTMAELGGAIGKLSGPLMAVVGISAAAGLVELGGVAASAAQSLLLIPAAAGAAGAAIGTVALATQGFGDALGAMGDPKKFAEALRDLSPNAQQAALSIQQLMPAFTQLRNATSDAFFANVGPQLAQLANTFLPQIQTLTTGIAGAMNEAFSGVAQQLMTPETQGAIHEFTSNVVSAFHELAPAMAPMIKAFAELASVGSQVLPDLARGAAEAARAFAAFINVHSQNGDLSRWLNEGLDTLGQLVPLAFELGKDFMALAPVGREILPEITSALKNAGALMPMIAQTAQIIGPNFALWGTALTPVVKLLQLAADAMAFLSGDANKIAQSNMLDARMNAALNSSGGINLTGGSASINRTAIQTGGIDPATGQWLPLPATAGPQGLGHGIGALSAGHSASAWGDGGPFGRSSSAAGASSDVNPTFDPSLWQVNPDLSKLAPGSDPSGVIAAGQQLSEANLRLLELKAKENVQQSTLVAAQNNVLQAQQKLDDETRKTWTSMQKTAQQFSQGMDQIGASLDADFGLGEGLPGLAKNLTMFLGNLIAAPELIKLQAISNINAQATGLQGGYGILGQMGAQNMAAGLSPLLGNPMPTGASTGAASAYYNPSAMGPAAFGGGMGGAPSEAQVKQIAAAFGLQVTSEDRPGDPGYHGKGMALDVSNGTGNTPQELAFAQYMAQNFGPALKELIYSDPAFSQLIGDGKNVTGTGYYGAGTLADHTNHVHVAAQWGSGTPTFSNSATSFSGFGAPGSKQAIANMIYQQASARGYSPHEATSIVAYAIGESGLNPGISGGVQGGSEVIGLFQQQPGFARGGGIDPSQRSDPAANTYAYLNQLDKHRNLPIEQALPATSVGGPLASGPGAQPQAWAPLMSQAESYLGGPGGAPSAGWTPGLGPLPTMGGAGQGPLLGSTAPGLGGAVGGASTGAGIQTKGGLAPAATAGGGGGGITPGGTIDTAIGAAAMGLDMIAPGAGQAAQTVSKLASRAIQFGGQAAAIGVSGLMETFLPHGSPLADPGKSWLGKIAGGVAGARPATPNTSQQKAQGAQQGGQQMGGGMDKGAGQPGIGVQINNPQFGGSDHQVADEINRHAGWAYSK